MGVERRHPGAAEEGMFMTTQIDAPAIDLATVEAFAGRIAGDQAVAYNALLVYLGDRLGLWKALASVEAATSEELAERSGLAERYVREWLAAQSAAGYLRYDADSRAFSLPPEHAMVLADDDSPAASIAGFEVIAAVWASADRFAHAYATGEGIGWHEHDPRLFTGVERFYSDLLPVLAAGRVAPVGRGAGRAARGRHPRRRRRLRAGLGHDHAGRGLPGLDVRRRRLPRGVDPSRDCGRRGRRGRRPGALRGGRRVVVRRQLRPGVLLRRTPRPG